MHAGTGRRRAVRLAVQAGRLGTWCGVGSCRGRPVPDALSPRVLTLGPGSGASGHGKVGDAFWSILGSAWWRWCGLLQDFSEACTLLDRLLASVRWSCSTSGTHWQALRDRYHAALQREEVTSSGYNLVVTLE